jgi:hypothetical protein
MKTKLSLIAMIAVAVIFTSCEGPEGPQGPAGAKGDTGAQGTAGQTGAAGATGTANVIYSAWADIPKPTTVGITPTGGEGPGTYRKQSFIPAPKVTKDVLDNGLILVYVRSSSSSTNIGQLPFSTPFSVNGAFVGTVTIRSPFLVGQISILEHWQGTGAAPSSYTSNTNHQFGQFRYIIIPGGTKARVKGLDYSNYEAVKAYYGLED